jgi:Fe-S-cluster containining protein
VAAARSCGPCTLCCTLLRVDELRKLGGTPCRELRAAPAAPGCAIHATRPAICRAYACLWLSGGLEEDDRPDRLGAVLDVATEGGVTRLRVHEAAPGAYERSARLREIVARYRESMPVRISDAARAGDPDAPVRELGPGGAELRLEGEWLVRLAEGREAERRRLPWLERSLRRLVLAWRERRLRGYY